ncbi:hypothetical protein [Methanocella sp. MCL-LM]|uniref:hypothetical protein n=1 Tax=Methanocella sp. MCL-LM TaxID=3412035 RepID=UPI003C7902E5
MLMESSTVTKSMTTITRVANTSIMTMVTSMIKAMVMTMVDMELSALLPQSSTLEAIPTITVN